MMVIKEDYRKSIRTIQCLLLFIIMCTSAYSQLDRGIKDRIYFGGNFGLQIGTITNVEVSPYAGYNVSDRFRVASGLSYRFYGHKLYGEWITASIYGWRAFSQLDIFDNILAHAEYELLNLNTETFGNSFRDPSINKRFFLSSFLVGGGYSMKSGTKQSAYVVLLWNVLETSETPYSNPVIRIGINF